MDYTKGDGQIGCEACIKKDGIISDMYEACNSFVCNIGFVKVSDESKDLLSVLVYNIEKALAKAEGK